MYYDVIKDLVYRPGILITELITLVTVVRKANQFLVALGLLFEKKSIKTDCSKLWNSGIVWCKAFEYTCFFRELHL
jgi:hypothetical protein